MTKKGIVNFFLVLVASAVLGLFYLFVRSNTPPSLKSEAQPTLPQNQIQPLAKPIISFADPSLGPPNAPYTIINFSDFRCPYCATTAADLNALQKKYPDKIRLISKDFAFLPPRASSERLHQAARCAWQENKFWEYHDWLFANSNLNGIKDEQLLTQAKNLGLDEKKFSSCLNSGAMQKAVQNNFAEGQRLGVDGTPYLFLNGEKVESVEEIKIKIK